MNEHQAISILMPVKNAALFLRECLDSIVNQEEANFELIAVDDHSTDSSLKILEEYQKKDPRVQVYKNKQQGIIAALRLAYKKSSGVFITRMDSDDIMSLYKLKRLKSNLTAFGVGHIALGKVKYFSESILGEGFIRYEHWLNTLIESGTNFNEIYKECVIPSPCWMVYREDLDRCEAFIPDNYPEDYDLAFRFYRKGLSPIKCDEVLHYWRDYASRTSRTHVHYSDNTFMDIKSNYFLQLEYTPKKELVIWGAGKKGKSLAKLLIAKNIPFTWICDNPNKIGKFIYDQKLVSFTYLESIENSQSIVTVANPKAQKEIRAYFRVKKGIENSDFFFFC